MTESTSPASALATALVAFQSKMPHVAKTKTANAGQYSYKYADLADVAAAATPLLVEHGLAFVCRPRLKVDGAGYELVGELLHTSGDSLSAALPLQGRSSQELGSSITYARRYLFGCLTGIVTDDDDDGAAASQAAQRGSQGSGGSQGRGSRQRPAQGRGGSQERPSASPALKAAKDAVWAAWTKSSGGDDKEALAKAYADWSKGEVLADVDDPSKLGAFAASLTEGAKK